MHLIKPVQFAFGIFEVLRLHLTFTAAITFFLEKQSHLSEDFTLVGDDFNPDILGSGVRTSTYILLLAMFTSLLFGCFHSGPARTKELGIATMIGE